MGHATDTINDKGRVRAEDPYECTVGNGTENGFDILISCSDHRMI